MFPHFSKRGFQSNTNLDTLNTLKKFDDTFIHFNPPLLLLSIYFYFVLVGEKTVKPFISFTFQLSEQSLVTSVMGGDIQRDLSTCPLF